MNKLSSTNLPDETNITDIRAVRSQEALRNALLALLQNKNLERISIRDISTTARVGYATFYRHYTDKEALLNDLATDQVNRLINLTLPIIDNQNNLSACQALCAYVDEQRSLWKTLLNGGAAGTIRKEMLRIARKDSITRSNNQGQLPTDLCVVLVVGSMADLLGWWLSQPDPLPANRIAAILDRIIDTPTTY